MTSQYVEPKIDFAMTHHPRIILLHDAQGQFGPLTDLRAIFQVRSGALSMLERLEASLGRQVDALAVAGCVSAQSYCQLVEQQTDRPVNQWGFGQVDSYLIINGRWLATSAVDQVLALKLGQVAVAASDSSSDSSGPEASGSLVAAHVDGDTATVWLDALIQNKAGNQPMPLPEGQVRQLDQAVLISRPWHIVEQLPQTLKFDLDNNKLPLIDRQQLRGVTTTGSFDIRVAPSARISPMVHLDASDGPIVIDEQAAIESFSLLAGPCYVGRQSQIVSHANLRQNAVIGNNCVIGGEVCHSIIQGRTSKCHTGYLGNALVGMWVNLGADTIVSNLKNTYSSVSMQLEANEPGQCTNMLKVGPLIGDFVRTAIGSRLTTGACIGTGSMLALSNISPRYVPRFMFVTDGKPSAYDIDKFIATARIMHARRDVRFTDALQQHLRQLAQS